MAYAPAMESIFANAQQNAAALIETATLAINAKVNTIEEAEKMIQELSSEAVMFNQLLTTIMNAMRQVESGDMQKEEAAGIIAPAVKELKDKCTALKIANVDAPGDDITEDEIAILRELIIGAKAAAEDRLVAIRMDDDRRSDPDVEAEVEEAYEDALSDDEIAMEAGILAAQYANTNDTKTAKALYSNAKKLYSLGEKEKALGYMRKAKSLYENALKNVLKSGKFEKVETVTKTSNGTMRRTATHTDSLAFNIVKASLEQKIDRCTAHILQWTTKAGKETYQQTLDQLKAEREEAKAAKKAGKATENYESEEYNMELFDTAYESTLDQCMLEELDYDAATEGANYQSHKLSRSYSKEIRGFAKQAKKAYKQGRFTESKNLYNKCADLCEELASEIKGMEQSITEVQIGKILHSLNTIGAALTFGGAVAGIIEDRRGIQAELDKLNSIGKSDLTRADLNKYTRGLISKAKIRADKFRKLAAKAGKGELAQSSATEAFDDFCTFEYNEFMFGCESLMDSLQMDLMTSFAFEADEEGIEDADGGEESGSSPSKIGTKIRGAFAKLKSAIKRGDKKAADEATNEINDAADELNEASTPEEKKGMSKAAKIGIAAAAATLVTAGAVVAGKKMKSKAESSADVNPTSAIATIKQAAKVAKTEGFKNKSKPVEVSYTDENGKKHLSRRTKILAGATVAAGAAAAGAAGKHIYDKKKAARDAAEEVEEAFGVPAYDVYEVILESMLRTEYDVSEESLLMSLDNL